MSVLRVGFETWQVRIHLEVVDMTIHTMYCLHEMLDIYILITVIPYVPFH